MSCSLTRSFEDPVSSLPPKTYTTGDGDEVQYYEIKRADVLIVGQTGTGKTTFLETLKNPKFRDDCHVVSQTRHASLHHVGFEVGDENYALSIIDTPGFSDTHNESDISLQTLILEFVKRGVTSLNMVLIALPMNRRIDANHIDTINGVLEFLGPEMADISYILGTHSERRTDDEKRAWAKELFKSPLSTLVRYTKKKFVWSGMLGDKLTEEQEREALVELKRNQENTIKKAISAVPVVLTGGEDIKNRFMVSESAAKDSMTLKGMVPLMSPLVESIRKKQDELNQTLSLRDKTKCPKLYEKAQLLSQNLSNIDLSELEKKFVEWEEMDREIRDYLMTGAELSQAANDIREDHNRLFKGEKEIRATQLTLDCRLDSDSDGEDFEI